MCDGTWNLSRFIGESEPLITVQRCSGCREQLVIHKSRGHDFPAEATDADILTHLFSPQA